MALHYMTVLINNNQNYKNMCASRAITKTTYVIFRPPSLVFNTENKISKNVKSLSLNATATARHSIFLIVRFARNNENNL